MAATRGPKIVRYFGTSAYLRGQLVKPPLAVFGLEGRYATALYSAASKQKVLDKVDAELNQVQQILTNNPKFGEFLASPIVQRDRKKAVIAEVLGKLNTSDVTNNFFNALSDNRRLNRISSIVRAFDKIMSAQKGEVWAEVATAKPLDAAQLKELNAALQAFLDTGKKLKIETKTDPSLIGGMTVSIGDRYVDLSISSKIKKYEKILRETI